MDVGGRRNRERSPERAKMHLQHRVKPFRKVQVVYYLTRNGQLEHPHYMEVTLLANHHLRLKDVTDRLTVLRGKGMPSLYSWSCKRSYKNGYVWNDLAENDVIPQAEGAEYVLKGSELLEDCTERFQRLQIGNKPQILESNFHPRRKPHLALTRHREPDEVDNTRYAERYEDEEDEDVIEEYEEKISFTSSNTPFSRCSRGVSTDELDQQQHHHLTRSQPQPQKSPTELTLENDSPPSTASTVSEKASEGNSGSKRFEDGDPVAAESTLSRNSVLLQLIACGSSVAGKGKNVAPTPKKPSNMAVKKSDGLLRGAVCRNAAAKVVVAVEDEEISCMSMNPRFGNLQAEEKEYFSGSIVESIMEERAIAAEPKLKKSSSYNEERSSKTGLGEEAEQEEKREKGAKVKCIPRKKSSSSCWKQSEK